MSPTPLMVLSVLISLNLSAQSIKIRFNWPSSSVPTISKAKLKYNKDFAYSFTFDDGNADGFTTVLPLLQGGNLYGVTYSPLQYTDGCGNALPFKAGIAWNTANPLGIDVHTGNMSSFLTWQQLDSLYRLGWDVLNHSYSHKSRSTHVMTSQDYAYEVEQNRVAVRQRTASRIEMPLFVVPTGDTNYYAPAIRSGHHVVFDQFWRLIGNRGLQVDQDIPTSPIKIHRQVLEANGLGMPVLDEVASRSNANSHFWYNQFAHRIDDYYTGRSRFNLFRDHIQKTAQKYGKNGSDKMWMAPLQEVYEYLIMRQLIQYSTQMVDKNMTIQFDLSRIPTWMRRKTITLLVNSSVHFSQIDAPQGVKVSFSGVSNLKMINLDFTNWRIGNSKMISHSSDFNASKDEFATPFKDENVENASNELSIFNEMGQLMMQNGGGTWADFDLSTLPRGMYIMVTRQGNNVSRSKFIKFE